jgi:hypothetical protein
MQCLKVVIRSGTFPSFVIRFFARRAKKRITDEIAGSTEWTQAAVLTTQSPIANP